MRYRCYLCQSRAIPGQVPAHEFEGDAPVCPRCHAGPPAVWELTDVHLLVPDEKGPILGLHGFRYRVGCQPRRDVLATPFEHFAATPDVRAVTCPSCQGLPEWLAGAKQWREMATAVRMVVEGKGCCG